MGSCPAVWMQVVYVDLRQALVEEVYRHSVQQARLGPVLEQIDEALGALCEATPKELHEGALRPLLFCVRLSGHPSACSRACACIGSFEM